MAGETRATTDPLDALVQAAGGTAFFQLVRLLERSVPGAPRVGHQGPASREAVRFRPDVSLAFPAADVAGLAVLDPAGAGGPRFRVTTTFLGLCGSASPLPSFYAEEMLSEDEEHDRVRAFLDLFHHRLLSLLYRCWSKYRPHVQFEYGDDDRFTPRLFSLIGLATPALREATGLPDPARLLHFGGLLGRQARSAAALEGLLHDYFEDLPVEVEQCVGSWVPVPAPQRLRLGRQAGRLGVDAVLGERVFDRAGRFRVWIGPVDEQRFQALLPGGQDHRVAGRLVSLYTNDSLEFDLGLRVEDPRPVTLGGGGGHPQGLGWNTWLAAAAGAPPREARVIVNRRTT